MIQSKKSLEKWYVPYQTTHSVVFMSKDKTNCIHLLSTGSLLEELGMYGESLQKMVNEVFHEAQLLKGKKMALCH